MPHSSTKRPKGSDPRNPLVFDTRNLGPGTARTLTRTAAAPEHLGVALARIPAGADLDLEVQLEGVTEGVLVTATVVAPLAAECARCLEPFSSVTRVRFQELFVLPGETGQDEEADTLDSYQLDGSGLLDLEPALRDAVVLDLPLSPLCEENCAGLCPQCGVRLADAKPGHGHEQRGAMWAALEDFRADERAAVPAEDEVPDPEAGPATTTHRTDAAPGRAKEF